MSEYLFFLLIVVIMSFMDVIDFRRPRDSGFWSITDDGWDAWHVLKFILYVLIVFYLIDFDKHLKYGDLSYEITIFIVLAVFPHYLILHKWLKEKGK